MPLQPQPSLISLRLSDIEFDCNAPFCKLQAALGHISQLVPTVTQQALKVLELAQPLLVVRVEKKDKRCYRLVGGYRTFQLLSEQVSRSRKTWAILLPDMDETTEARLAAFDAVISKLLLRPNGKDLAVIASTLQRDEKLRQDATSLMALGTTDNELAAALGMARTTLYRQTEAVKTALSQLEEHQETSNKVDMEIPTDDELEE
jgi:hypothetical protein